MTTRDDVTIDYNRNPRVAEVAAPSVEFVMQDIVDTLRVHEEEFMGGLPHEKLLDASGKEPLGGVVSNGITVTLQDTQISFEARRTPAESGTVTTGSTGAVVGELTFVDIAADYTTAAIQAGSMVINFTDGSIADVKRVDNSTTLTTKVLVNGATNTFQIGDAYQVFNIIQCELVGGNLVAFDDIGGEISPVLPTAFTQVIRVASSSATLVSTAGLTPSQQEIRDAMLLAPGGAAAVNSIDDQISDVPSAVVTAINAELYDGRAFEDIMIDVLAMVSGRIEETVLGSGIFKFYERDNTTVRFTLTKASNERNRS